MNLGDALKFFGMLTVLAGVLVGIQYGPLGFLAGGIVGAASAIWFFVGAAVLDHLKAIAAALERLSAKPQESGRELVQVPDEPKSPGKPVVYGVNPQVPAPQRILSPDEVAETVAAMRAAQPKYRS